MCTNIDSVIIFRIIMLIIAILLIAGTNIELLVIIPLVNRPRQLLIRLIYSYILLVASIDDILVSQYENKLIGYTIGLFIIVPICGYNICMLYT